jgi:hypothetical protein
MTPATFLSGLFIVFGLPFVAIVGGGIIKRWLAYKEQVATIMGERTAERAAQYATKVERLEQRMAVLERILTDRSTRLGEEIDRLHDAPVN